jgi:hypothetical protein
MTSFFAVYDPATGAILRTGFCTQSADLALQARAGEAVVACDRLCPGDRFRVDVAAAPPRIVAR